MKLTGEEVVEIIEQYKKDLDNDPLSPPVRNQQVVAIEAALLRVKQAEEEKVNNEE